MKTLILSIVSFLCASQAFAKRVNPAEIEYYRPRLIIVVNKAQKATAQDAQTLEAFLDGELLYRTIVSTAKEDRVHIPPNERYPEGHTYYAGTYEGVFRIHDQRRFHKSGKWGGSSMNFAQFFDGGIAIHATTEDHYHELGRRASGGCVRLHPRDAEIMWDLVGKIGLDQTRIIVYDGTWTPHPLGRSGDYPRYALSDPRTIKKKVVKKKKPAAPKVVVPPADEPSESTTAKEPPVVNEL